MTKHEIKIAVITLALIAGAALFLSQRKATLGKPGLVIESQIMTNDHGIKIADKRIALPTGVPGYKDELMAIADMELDLPKDTTFGRRRYQVSSNGWVQMTAILMGTDRTSIHKPYYCVTGQGWTIDKAEVIKIPMARPRPYELEAQFLTTTATFPNKDGSVFRARGLFMYWFVSDTQLTPNHKEQMWWLARDLLTTGVLQRWGYISCFSFCAPGDEKIRLEQMKRLVSETVPSFQIPPGKDAPITAFLDTAAPLQ